MSGTGLSENEAKTIQDAFKVIDSRTILDHHFPDLGDVFAAPGDCDYLKAAGPSVLPMIVKQSILLPDFGFEKIKQLKPNSPIGVFPDINRAYFAVENRLYLWDYAERAELEMHEEPCEIVGVGLVTPKADVFNSEVTHVLVIATVTEIKLVALSLKKTPSGNTLSFYATGYTNATDNVRMLSIVGTCYGRILMLGNDGNVWEFVYRSEEGWFTSKCYKQLLQSTTSLSFLFMALHEPCTAIAVSADGQTLYQLYANSSIQVIHLGKGTSGVTHVTKKANILQQVLNASTQYPLPANSTLVSLHATSPEESTQYQLVAITSHGQRLYFSHFSSTQHTSTDPPNALELIYVRPPPPPPAPATTTPLLPSATTNLFSTCMYSNAVLFLVGTAQENPTLTTTSPDIGKLANMGVRAGLTELMDKLDVQGKVFSMVEIPIGPFVLNELSTQPLSYARHFLVFTSLGMTVLKKQRPVDMLRGLLSSAGIESRFCAAEFETFFAHFGPVASTALCYEMACSETVQWTPCPQLTSDSTISTGMVEKVSELLESLGHTPSALPPGYTSRHDGLALYLARLLEPLRSHPLVEEHSMKSKRKHTSPRIATRDELVTLQHTLRRLQSYIDQHATVFHHLTPRTPEDHSILGMYKLIGLSIEAIIGLDKKLQ
ncbi:Nup133 N terminal like-domain-containing protein [Spinellus fusiger]|nr:Nup133 N terminal like-domain-containing protein [Spinellus fusiger]